jgi:hypothetical protein
MSFRWRTHAIIAAEFEPKSAIANVPKKRPRCRGLVLRLMFTSRNGTLPDYFFFFGAAFFFAAAFLVAFFID